MMLFCSITLDYYMLSAAVSKVWLIIIIIIIIIIVIMMVMVTGKRGSKRGIIEVSYLRLEDLELCCFILISYLEFDDCCYCSRRRRRINSDYSC